MAKVYKVICDRCKKEIHVLDDFDERKIWLSGKGREGGLDLCDECYEELFKWFMQFCIDEVKIPENTDNYFPNICKTCRYSAENRSTVYGAPIAEKICKSCNRGTHYEKFMDMDVILRGPIDIDNMYRRMGERRNEDEASRFES